jgi:HAD superfamily hydrolase (TIGR01450 family)
VAEPKRAIEPDEIAAIAGAGAWILDVDGCIVRTAKAGGAGGKPMPGAIDFVRWLKAEGKRIVVCTNASEKPAVEYVRHLRAIGFDIADSDLVTAATAVADHVASVHGHGPVVALGGPGLDQALAAAGVERWQPGAVEPQAVVVGGAESYASSDLSAACLAIAEHRAAFYVTVNVPWFHGGRGRSVASSTAIAHAITGITRAKPIVCGKPSAALAAVLQRRLEAVAGDLVVVGDVASVEMRMARQMGGYGVLVLSGGTSAAEVPGLPEQDRPHLVVADTADLLTKLRETR